MIEIESLDEFDAHLDGINSLRDVAVQGLDLRQRSWRLLEADVRGSFFLGCNLESSALEHLNAEGACVFPSLDGLPIQPFRGTLYTAEELYKGYEPGDHPSYDQTPDGTAYQWHQSVISSSDVVATLIERIHDHAIDNALEHLLVDIAREQVVAIMGGHSLSRSDDTYVAVARLGRELTAQGFYIATGGGPGAMEAANLGAWFAGRPTEDLDLALDVLAGAATFEPVGRWLDAAFEVRDRWPRPVDAPGSLGIPTWHYGHEPPNVFATEIAKYFANSIREEGLLAIALGGVVFAPGSAGTIQEVFQDAAQNHYSSFGTVSPMVFLDTEYWTNTKPVYPLLKLLSADREYGDQVVAFDLVSDIVDFIAAASKPGPA